MSDGRPNYRKNHAQLHTKPSVRLLDDPHRWVGLAVSALARGLLECFAMGAYTDRLALKSCRLASLLVLMLCSAPHLVRAQAPAVPEWAQPGSATHVQVPPPANFHRRSRNFDTPIGVFQGQSDVGAAVLPGSANYDAGTKQYTINSAGYNVWYSRDEFRYLWKKMFGDLSLAADATFPNPHGYNDRKAMLVIRQNLDDNSKEAVVGEHGTGMIHLAQRPERNALMTDEQFRFGGTLAKVKAKRIGIEKHADGIAIFISLQGEPMHQFGPPITLHFDEPFYVGIGFCSHLPDKSDTAVLSNVILENFAGKVH
ncbi:MAG: biopolymer transporter Tol [Bryobacteraceae bacterium]